MEQGKSRKNKGTRKKKKKTTHPHMYIHKLRGIYNHTCCQVLIMVNGKIVR